MLVQSYLQNDIEEKSKESVNSHAMLSMQIVPVSFAHAQILSFVPMKRYMPLVLHAITKKEIAAAYIKERTWSHYHKYILLTAACICAQYHLNATTKTVNASLQTAPWILINRCQMSVMNA